MDRTLEAIFHRPIQLLILIIFLPLVSLAVVFILPRSYHATAKLWAWRSYPTLGTTSQEIDPQTNAPITPAQSQANALSELLQTRDFALIVAQGTALARTLGLDSSVLANPQRLDDAIFQEISHQVQVAAQGSNLFSINYTNHDPEVAQRVIEAIIQHYGLQSQAFIITQGQQLLSSYQRQLTGAQNDADTAAKAEAQYLLAHPNLTGNALLTDPQYQLLHAQTQQKQTIVMDILTHIGTINTDISMQSAGPDSLFIVVDPPASQVVPRINLLLIAGGIGLGTAFLAWVLYVFIIVRRDRAVYTAHDLQKVTPFPVVMQLPHLSPAIVPLLAKGSVSCGIQGRGEPQIVSTRE
jgi:hypothetical protein